MADSQESPSLEAQRTAGNTKGSAGPSTTEVGRRPTGDPTPVLRNLDRGMRPAKDIRQALRGNRIARPRGVQKTIAVLIEKEVPNLVLADSDFSMPVCSDGWTWKRTVTKYKWSKVVAERQTGGEDISNMTYSIPDLLWSVSSSLTQLTKVKNDLLAENHETISGA